MVTELNLEAITIGVRRREDMGDIQGLADSIGSIGLLHPIVVDDSGLLIAGGRRLEACRRLGWESVPVRSLGELTEAERREVELQENLRRKDLTPHEASRTIVNLAEVAAEVDRQEFRSEPDRNSPGRPTAAGSDRRVADRTGIPKTTIIEARQHVAAAEKYPELAAPDVSQQEAITIARKLDDLPEPEREQVREAIAPPPPSEPPDDLAAARRRQVREVAKAEQAKSDELIAVAMAANPEGAAEVERARIRRKWAEVNAWARSRWLPLDVPTVLAAMTPEDNDLLRWFMRDCRQWIDELEREMGRDSDIRLVVANDRARGARR